MRPILILFLLLILVNCSSHIYQIKQPYLITIKSKKLKFSDLGFIAKSKKEDSILINIFSLGHQILKLEIDNFISIDDGVPIPPSLFNSQYLSSDYPPNILKNIFLGKPIFQGEKIKFLANGFFQEFQSIKYRVSQSEIYFKDSKNHILIKLKRENSISSH